MLKHAQQITLCFVNNMQGSVMDSFTVLVAAEMESLGEKGGF